MPSLRQSMTRVFPMCVMLHLFAGTCCVFCGCSGEPQRGSVQSKQSDSEVLKSAQDKDDTTLSATRKIDNKTGLEDGNRDRIEVLTTVQDGLDRQAIQAAVDWLKSRSADPLDIEVRLRRRGDSRSVYVDFVFRDEHGEPFYVPGGHCTITVSKSGQIVDVMKGA